MMKRLVLLGSGALIALGATPAAAQFRAALDVADATVREGAQSQQRIDELDEGASALLGEYRAQVKQLELTERYNVSRERQVQNQLEDIRSFEQDLENFEGVKRAVTPLMEEMIAQLGELIEADVPFYLEERRQRLQRLNALMNDSSQNEASRYGFILEAYEIEAEYGRTISAYEGTVEVDGEELAVEFLQIGRVALIYKTSDDAILRIYNAQTGQYEDLDRGYLGDIREAFRVANDQAAPRVLAVPVPAPTEASASAPAASGSL